jgi:hypothetical protein
VIKEESSLTDIGPSDDDLMAIADAVREVANLNMSSASSSAEGVSNNLSHQDGQIGRRGHLRAVPS